MIASTITVKLKIILTALLIFITSQTVCAHPHVFIESSIKVIFEDYGLEGIAVEWKFDSMFSSMLISDYDSNKNKRFDADEIASIEKKAFSNIAKYNYFSYIIIGKRRYDIKEVSGFTAELTGNNVKYFFFIPFKYPYQNINGDIFFGFFDKTIYCDFQYMPEKPFTVKAPPDVTAIAIIVNNKDFWKSKRAPEEIRIKLKRTKK